MKNNNKVLATFAAIGAQVIFGFSFMFTKIALGFASPMTVVADRFIVAFLGLSIVVLFTKTKFMFKSNIWKLILMATFQPFLYFIFESYGIKMTTSVFSSIMISLIPVVSMISGIFMLKEIPSPMQYMFTALSVVGVAIMAFTGNREGTVSFLGILLLFGAVLSSVAYNIASRKISAEFTALERTYMMTLVGMVSFVLIALVENRGNILNILNPVSDISYLSAILYLGIISSVLAFFLLNYANTYLPVAKTTVFSNLTTVVSVIAGALFLDEKISLEAILSTVMIIIGVWGVQVMSVKNKEKDVI